MNELVLFLTVAPLCFWWVLDGSEMKVSLIIPPCPTKQILKFISCLSCVLFQSYNKYLELVWSRVIATDAENSKKLINGSIWNVGVALIWWYQVQCTIIICIQYTHTHMQVICIPFSDKGIYLQLMLAVSASDNKSKWFLRGWVKALRLFGRPSKDGHKKRWIN